MSCYKELYLELLNGVSDIVDDLNKTAEKLDMLKCISQMKHSIQLQCMNDKTGTVTKIDEEN